VSVFAGSFAARNVPGEADEDYKKYYRYFSNRRHFALPSGLVKIIGKPLIFAEQRLGKVLSGGPPPQARS
jgi:gamma-glutamylputrescine oxidase